MRYIPIVFLACLIFSCSSDQVYVKDREKLLKILEGPEAENRLKEFGKKRIMEIESEMGVSEGKGLFHYFIETDRLDEYKLLYDFSFNEYGLNDKSYYPLDYAIVLKKDEFVSELLKNSSKSTDSTLLLAAENLKNQTFCKVLSMKNYNAETFDEILSLNKGKLSDENIYSIKNQIISEIINGFENGNSQTKDYIKLALNHQIELTKLYQLGYTKLHLACFMTDYTKISQLIEDGISPNSSAKGIKQPIYFLLKNNKTRLAQLLLENGAVIDTSMLRLDNFDANAESKEIIWNNLLKVSIAESDSTTAENKEIYEFDRENFPAKLTINQPQKLLMKLADSLMNNSYRSIHYGQPINVMLGYHAYNWNWLKEFSKSEKEATTGNISEPAVLSFLIRKISHSPVLAEYFYHKYNEQIFNIIDSTNYYRFGINSYVNSLLQTYSDIRKHDGFTELLDEAYDYLEEGRLDKANKLFCDEEDFWNYKFDFWARRYHQGTMQLTLEILNDFKNRYQNVDYFEASELTVQDSFKLSEGMTVYLSNTSDSTLLYPPNVLTAKTREGNYISTEPILFNSYWSSGGCTSNISLNDGLIIQQTCSGYKNKPENSTQFNLSNEMDENGILVEHISNTSYITESEKLDHINYYKIEQKYDFEGQTFQLNDFSTDEEFINPIITVCPDQNGEFSSNMAKVSEWYDSIDFFDAGTARFYWNDSAIICKIHINDSEVIRGQNSQTDHIEIFCSETGWNKKLTSETSHQKLSVYMDGSIVGKITDHNNIEHTVTINGDYTVFSNSYELEFTIPPAFFGEEKLNASKVFAASIVIHDQDENSHQTYSNNKLNSSDSRTYSRMILVKHDRKPVLNNNLLSLP